MVSRLSFVQSSRLRTSLVALWPARARGRPRLARRFTPYAIVSFPPWQTRALQPDIRQKLAGHDDSKVHANYTHHELQTLRGTIEKLPRLE
jgi:hypothetical protein